MPGSRRKSVKEEYNSSMENSVDILKNDNKHIELRKQQKILMVSGLAMIAFGVWSLTKYFAQTFLDRRFKDVFTEANNGEPLSAELLIAAVVIFCILMAIILGVHWIAGYGAYRKGKGIKAGAGYMIADVLICVLTSISIISYFRHFEVENFVGEFIPDVSLVFISVVIIVSSRKVNKLQKELAAEKGGMK